MSETVVKKTEENPVTNLGDAARVWAKVGFLSFGGPAAQIALMHREIVEERKWLSERQYLNALSFCMLLPGPEAMQLATYVGWRMHGTSGGLLAGLLFLLPGAIVTLMLAMFYVAFGNVPMVNALFLGIKAAVVVIVLEALLRVSKRALKHWEHWIVAALAFVAIFFFAVPFPVLIGMAALWGFMRSNATDAAYDNPEHVLLTGQNRLGKTLSTALIWLVIWLVPLLGLGLVAGAGILPDIAYFFSKLAVVTFGGAYAVLAYMAQDVVNAFGWLNAGQMMDGLGLAETTPGPLILVTEFVGFIAAYRDPPMWMGLAGAVVTLWATFAPCFLWIFVGAPYIDWIATRPRLRGALSMITASVVGVILNLAIWFALHVFFAEVSLVQHGWLQLWRPDFMALDWRVVLLSGACAILLLKMHWGIAWTLLLSSLCSAALVLVG